MHALYVEYIIWWKDNYKIGSVLINKIFYLFIVSHFSRSLEAVTRLKMDKMADIPLTTF